MATNYTNREAAQALKGQAVLVTVNSSDSANLYLLRKGQLATNASGKTGTVYSVDVYGTSFLVTPIQPDRDFGSTSVYGYLPVGDVVSVST